MEFKEEILDFQIGKEASEEVSFEERSEQLQETGYSYEAIEFIKEAFSVFGENPGGFIGFLVLTFMISAAAGVVPFGGLFITPPLAIGSAIMTRAIMRGEHADFSLFFNGFKKYGHLLGSYLVSSLIAGLVIGVLVGPFIFYIAGNEQVIKEQPFLVPLIGLAAIPGMLVALTYSWASFIIMFEDLEFWPAMEHSRKLIMKNIWGLLGMLILLSIVNFLGMLLIGLGLLVTIPVTSIAMYVAYDRIVYGYEGDEEGVF